MVVNLDEVNSKAFQLTHSEPRLLGVCDGKAIRKAWRRVIHHRARGDDLRAEHRARPDTLSQRQNKSASPPMSRVPTLPLAMNRSKDSSPVPRWWECISQRPGIRNVPFPLTRLAPLGIAIWGPNAAMRSPWVSTVTPVLRACFDVDYSDTNERHRHNSAINC